MLEGESQWVLREGAWKLFKSWTLPVAVAIVIVYRGLLVFCRAGAVYAAQGLDLNL